MVEIDRADATDVMQIRRRAPALLVAAGEFLRRRHAALFRNEKQRAHFHAGHVSRLRFRRHHAAIGSMI